MATIAEGKGVRALAAFDKEAELKIHEIGRPSAGPNDVEIDIKFCGMCHSDLHSCNMDWGINKYPIAPGHEIAGIVRAVGDKVTKFKVGDRVGVGCAVLSCFDCNECKQGLEQHCIGKGRADTYGATWAEGVGLEECAGHFTNGGYSESITVHERFTFGIPDSLPLEYAAPLLCAGITTYSPLARHVKGKEGVKVGVVGFGGLGHVSTKIAVAMGAEVTVLSRSNKKQAEIEAVGATLLVHSDKAALKAASRTLDVIINTAAAFHDVMALTTVLKVGGTHVLIGGVGRPYPISAFALLMNRWRVEGSLTGGCPETAEMLEFCAKHDIKPDIDVIHAKDASAAFNALKEGSLAHRKVIDISTLASL